jgi:hypothetical protein
MGIVNHSFYRRPGHCGVCSGLIHTLAISWAMLGALGLVRNEWQIYNNQLILACNGNLFN